VELRGQGIATWSRSEFLGQSLLDSRDSQVAFHLLGSN
jgi:hypothetical protein